MRFCSTMAITKSFKKPMDLGENAVPFGLRDALTTGEIDIEHKFLERGESRLPGGIDTTREW